jgi:hypothetical protein
VAHQQLFVRLTMINSAPPVVGIFSSLEKGPNIPKITIRFSITACLLWMCGLDDKIPPQLIFFRDSGSTTHGGSCTHVSLILAKLELTVALNLLQTRFLPE